MGIVSFLPWARDKAKRDEADTYNLGETRVEVRVEKPTDCLSCGTENKTGSRYCVACGRMLV